MKELIKRLRAWYDKWLKPLRPPGVAFIEDVGRALTEQLRDVPGPEKLLCAVAKVKGLREDQYVTGCKYQLPLQEHCRECPYWSESRYLVAFGKYIGAGFDAGLKSTEKKEEGEGGQHETKKT